MKHKSKCSVLDCEKPNRSRGYCRAHYRKFVFLPNHSLYGIWGSMLQRCYNPKNPKYHYYGGRGITVCEQWRNSYYTFTADVGLRPSPKHSIARIDNNGNYEPGNVQWATQVQQMINTGISLRNNTGVKGVYWDDRYQRFHATITINRRRHHLGRYKTLPAAARARYLAEARYTV